MHLEYDSMGQPCGKWRKKYVTQIGLCQRKISILYDWKDVPEGLKQTMWDDTGNILHIQSDKDKIDVFFSALAERFRAFKSKLVSGWITFTRKRTKKTKKKDAEGKEAEGQNENEEGNGKEKENEKPIEMPYEIWNHISMDEWQAFVAKKTTKKDVKRERAAMSSKQKKFHHRMGAKTYCEARVGWITSGLYPTLPNPSTTMATSSQITTAKVDRSFDLYCALHGKDEHGNSTISELTKKIADALLGYKEKEAKREFTPTLNKDVVHMVLGKDHRGRVRGKGLDKPLRDAITPTWKTMQCAQQEDGVQCGYYVMRFMFDVVRSCIEVKDLETIYNTPREGPFTIEEINEVRDKLASYMTENCF